MAQKRWGFKKLLSSDSSSHTVLVKNFPVGQALPALVKGWYVSSVQETLLTRLKGNIGSLMEIPLEDFGCLFPIVGDLRLSNLCLYGHAGIKAGGGKYTIVLFVNWEN